MTDMEPAPADNLVRAAGAVLVDGDRVALVHRPRYDDWTLPKGKHEPGEDDIAAALREVREETGFHGRIERDLGVVRYTVEKHGAVLPKVVRYYVMRVGGGRVRAQRRGGRTALGDPRAGRAAAHATSATARCWRGGEEKLRCLRKWGLPGRYRCSSFPSAPPRAAE